MSIASSTNNRTALRSIISRGLIDYIVEPKSKYIVECIQNNEITQVRGFKYKKDAREYVFLKKLEGCRLQINGNSDSKPQDWGYKEPGWSRRL